MFDKSLIQVFSRLEINDIFNFNLIITNCDYSNENLIKKIQFDKIKDYINFHNETLYFGLVSEIIDDNLLNRKKHFNKTNSFFNMDVIKEEVIKYKQKILIINYFRINTVEKLYYILEYMYAGIYSKSFIIDANLDNFQIEDMIEFKTNKNALVSDIIFKNNINNISKINSISFSYGNDDFGCLLFLTLI